ncbi:MAG TPA: hypothetical protein VJT74_17130 [Pyrinomonadaceae bacterium]|nr:hypothetical protein [Pyrinomonadaceae bacterium]
MTASSNEIEAVVRGFESCTTPPAEFKHASHLIVALCYLHDSRLTIAEAAERLRAALYRYLDHNGVDRLKYNETITIFWLRRVRAFLDGATQTRTTAELAAELLERYSGGAKLVNDYYSQERLFSAEARDGWVEPDLKPLDF